MGFHLIPLYLTKVSLQKLQYSLILLKPIMRAIWGLLLMALSAKEARTNSMPLKLNVVVSSTEIKKDYGISNLVPGYGRASQARTCLYRGDPCRLPGQKDNCCRGLICFLGRNGPRCVTAENPNKCLKRNAVCKYNGRDACCRGLLCKLNRMKKKKCTK